MSPSYAYRFDAADGSVVFSASARAAGYRGRVGVGHDLMRIPLTRFA